MKQIVPCAHLGRASYRAFILAYILLVPLLSLLFLIAYIIYHLKRALSSVFSIYFKIVMFINREDVQEKCIEQCITGTTACGRPIGKQTCWGLMSLLLGQSSYPVALPEYIDVCSQGVVGRTESHHQTLTAKIASLRACIRYMQVPELDIQVQG